MCPGGIAGTPHAAVPLLELALLSLPRRLRNHAVDPGLLHQFVRQLSLYPHAQV
jgi:hypothetical protein